MTAATCNIDDAILLSVSILVLEEITMKIARQVALAAVIALAGQGNRARGSRSDARTRRSLTMPGVHAVLDDDTR
jgi:hypothetical protein